jgi:DNA invertase Pin-like site-specific DNA recombinase
VNVAIYARVSTNQQNTEAQILELRRFCAARGWTITGEFIDTGFSGTKSSRPNLDKMLADVRRRQFDAVCVWKWDRFARSLSFLIATLREFEALGVQFVSVSEGTDTTTPQGRLLFNIMGALAEFERELIRERVRLGMANTRKKIGRPKSNFNRLKAEHLYHVDHWPIRKIARELRVPVSTLRDYLADEKRRANANIRPSEITHPPVS